MNKNKLWIFLIIIIVIAIIVPTSKYLNNSYIEIRYIGSNIGSAVVGWATRVKTLSINKLGKYEYLENNNSNSKENYTIKSGNIKKYSERNRKINYSTYFIKI